MVIPETQESQLITEVGAQEKEAPKVPTIR